jgi:hypothetical protein
MAAAATAQETWKVVGGRTSIRFEEPKMRALGLVPFVTEGLEEELAPGRVTLTFPYATFPIDPSSDLAFLVDRSSLLPGGLVSGSIRHQGGFLVDGRDFAAGGGDLLRFDGFAIDLDPADAPVAGRALPALDLFTVTSGSVSGEAALRVGRGRIGFDRASGELLVQGADLFVTPALADRLGRPEIAGKVVGEVEIHAETVRLFGVQTVEEPPAPDRRGTFLDVKLGILDDLDEWARQGTYPNGISAMSCATTSCNVGDVDVPWLGPMAEDHPLILQTVYREKDGRFEMIGQSWLKHGFFALSNSQCTPCQNPSNGTFLGVGCSDTYSASNNASQYYLGPREEANGFTAEWSCTGSHFDGTPVDCSRSHGSSGHSAIDHRLQVADADLGNPGAVYYYEGMYLVRGDQNKKNNAGSRRATFQWTGSSWNVTTPSSGNPLYEGTTLLRWSDMATSEKVSIGPNDGEITVAADTNLVSPGVWNYEYGVHNFDSDRGIESFSVPLPSGANVSNVGFHDPDFDAGNDWTATVTSMAITWSTTAHPLEFGTQFNFRFDADVAPELADAVMLMHEAGVDGDTLTAETLAPQTSNLLASPGPAATPAALAIGDVSPNPFNPSTTVHYTVPEGGAVTLEIVDVSGRRVRSLFSGVHAGGSHVALWNGLDDSGRPAASGVYLVRLESAGRVETRKVTLVR